MRRNKRQSKNEFRFNYDTGHMTYIFEKVGRRYRSVGITHHETTFGKPNMPLKKNPQRGHSEPAYIRNGIISKRDNSYATKVDRRHKFSTNDYRNVKSKIRNYKNRRRKRK